jgi:hypothetical protein
MSAPSIPQGARAVRQPGGYTFYIHGEERTPLRDLYHNFLRWRWSVSLALIAAGFLAVNLVFAAIYVEIGGVENMPAGSFWNALVFSVETLGTIGYGTMSPTSPAAETVMMIEAVTGLIVTALATGLVFSKFARATARVAFTSNMVIAMHEGKPTLTFRIGNRRANAIVDARLGATLALTRITAEGETFYKLHDLKLVRDRMGAMRRGWVAMHVYRRDEPAARHGCGGPREGRGGGRGVADRPRRRDDADRPLDPRLRRPAHQVRLPVRGHVQGDRQRRLPARPDPVRRARARRHAA